MTVYVGPNSSFEASLFAADSGTGLVGTLRVSVIDPPSGLTITSPTTAGIVERPTGSSLYHWVGTSPANQGSYRIVWDLGSDATLVAVEDLMVTGARPPDAPVSGPPGAYSGRFAKGHPLLFEQCSVLRYEQIGSEDGTPIQGTSIIESKVPCRIDTHRSGGMRRNDFTQRNKQAVLSREYALAFLPVGVQIKAGDRIVMTSGQRLGTLFQVINAEAVSNGYALDHINAEIEVIDGAI